MRRVFCVTLMLLFGSAQATPLVYSWSGTLQTVFEDTGTTTFSGTSPGANFSGTFTYDSTPGTIVTDDMQTCDVSLCEWEWSGAANVGTLNALPAPISGVFLIQENDNDVTENPDDLGLINSILDPDIMADTPFDLWELSSDLISPDGVLFVGVTYISTDTTTITDASVFDSVPPFGTIPAAGQAVAFAIQEETTSGSFLALGVVTSSSVTPVPVPAAAWLFGSALGLLAWARRRAQTIS